MMIQSKYGFAAAVTQIGSSHVRRKVPCEDASLVGKLKDGFFIAVSDGHGGTDYPRSREGSRLACDLAYELALKYQESVFCCDMETDAAADASVKTYGNAHTNVNANVNVNASANVNANANANANTGKMNMKQKSIFTTGSATTEFAKNTRTKQLLLAGAAAALSIMLFSSAGMKADAEEDQIYGTGENMGEWSVTYTDEETGLVLQEPYYDDIQVAYQCYVYEGEKLIRTNLYTLLDEPIISSEYDGEGKILSKIKYNEDGSVSASYTYEYETDEAGKSVSGKRYNAAGEMDRSFEYDSDGNMVCAYSTGGTTRSKYEYEYDTSGNLIKKTTYNESGDEWIFSKSDAYEYDGEGNEIRDICYYDEGSTATYRVYEYDSLGNLTSEEYYVDGEVSSSVTYQYDEKGFRVNSDSSDGTYMEYEYNERGVMIAVKNYPSYMGGKISSKNEYDGWQGGLLQRSYRYTYSDDTSWEETIYAFVVTYDDEGYISKMQTIQEKKNVYENGELAYSYYYDEAGNITRVELETAEMQSSPDTEDSGEN